MLVSDMYLSVKQELFPIGNFTEGAVIDSEIALVFDNTILDILREITKNLITEKTVFHSTLLLDLKEDTDIFEYVKLSSTVAAFNMPTNCLLLLKDNTHVLSCYVDYNETELIIGNYYKVKSEQAKINGTWYFRKDNKYIKATSKEFFGDVQEVSFKTIDNRLTATEKLQTLKHNRFYSPNKKSFLSELIDNRSIRVHLPEQVLAENRLLGLNVVYYKNPIEFKKLSSSVNSPYSDLVNNELITLAVQKIKSRDNR